MKLPPGVSITRGTRPGPVIAVVAGIHGNETAPVRALRVWQRQLRPLQVHGLVYFIIGNPLALKQCERFLDENLNRAFGRTVRATTLEARRAKELEPILRRCSAVLDLHASNSHRTKRFLIAEPHTLQVGRYLPFPTIIHGFDRFEPGGVDWFANSTGGMGLCAECGYLDRNTTLQTADRTIPAFLVATGVLEGTHHTSRQHRKRIHSLYRNRKAHFKPIKAWPDFSYVRRGQIIGYDGYKPLRSPINGQVLFVRESQIIGQECCLFLRP